MSFHLAYFLTPQFTTLGRATVIRERLLYLGFLHLLLLFLPLYPLEQLLSQGINLQIVKGHGTHIQFMTYPHFCSHHLKCRHLGRYCHDLLYSHNTYCFLKKADVFWGVISFIFYLSVLFLVVISCSFWPIHSAHLLYFPVKY